MVELVVGGVVLRVPEAKVYLFEEEDASDYIHEYECFMLPRWEKPSAELLVALWPDSTSALGRDRGDGQMQWWDVYTLRRGVELRYSRRWDTL